MSDSKEVPNNVDGASVHRVVHTPGPWRLIDGKSEVVAEDCFHIAFVKAHFQEHVETQRKNAELIAEAPEMFQVIQRLAEPGFIGETELKMLIQECRRIVAKVV